MMAFVGYIFKMICVFLGWIVKKLFELIGWVFSFDVVLKFQAILTYVGFFVCFRISKYWHGHIGHPQSLAPTPTSSIVLLDFWHTIHYVLVETVYYLAIATIGVLEVTLLHNWRSPRLARVREVLGSFKTLGQLRKTAIEIFILRLIVLIGDILCDPKEVDLLIFLAFVFAYLHFASFFKLLGMCIDFGWLDGLVSIMLTAFEHFVRPWTSMQLLGILLTTIVVCYKNTMWSGHGERIQQQGGQEEEAALVEMATRGERSEEEGASMI